MIRDLPITEARHELTSLPRRLKKSPCTVAVTRRGKPVLALLPWDLYESLMETVEIMGDPDLMAHLRRAIQEANSGKLIPWEQVRRRLSV